MSQLATQTSVTRQIPTFIGESQQARRVRHFAQLASEFEHTVLILGESGTGKDHLAEYIHGISKLSGSFVRVDCGALSTSLTETELFGHVQGAFTDAKAAKPGLIKAAENGTLFFNEVANMTLETQAKFLAIIERKPFRPVGSTREVPINARIIAATNANLSAKIKLGEFRSDLYYRLDCLTCEVAPLRERREDIPLLTDHFQQQWHRTARFTDEAMRVMAEYPWPGNIRLLESFIKKVLVFSTQDEIGARAVAQQLEEGDRGGIGEATDLPTSASQVPTTSEMTPLFKLDGNNWPSLREVRERAASAAESQLIRAAMIKCGYNRTKVAALLQVHYKRLINRIKELPDLEDMRGG